MSRAKKKLQLALTKTPGLFLASEATTPLRLVEGTGLAVARAEAAAVEGGAEAAGSTRSFFTVQNAEDMARLRAGGAPWPTAPNKAHLGEGFYSFGTRAEAEAYQAHLTKFLPAGTETQIGEFQIDEELLGRLKTMDLRGNDELAESFLNRYSRLDAPGELHGFEHVIRPGGIGTEHYFSPSAFSLFKLTF